MNLRVSMLVAACCFHGVACDVLVGTSPRRFSHETNHGNAGAAGDGARADTASTTSAQQGLGGGSGQDSGIGVDKGGSTAGGVAGSGGTDTTANTRGTSNSGPSASPGGSAGAGGTPATPAVTQVSPGEGQRGVTRDTELTITFSKPMNMEATWLALELPALATAHTWNSEGTELSIQLGHDYPQSFRHNGVSLDVESEDDLRVDFRIDDSALDDEGFPLDEYAGSFYLLRHVTDILDGDPQRSGTIAGQEPLIGKTQVHVGDEDDVRAIGLVGYSLLSFPNAAELLDASLKFVQAQVAGDPYALYGDLRLTHIPHFDTNCRANLLHDLQTLIPDTGHPEAGTEAPPVVFKGARESVLDDLTQSRPASLYCAYFEGAETASNVQSDYIELTGPDAALLPQLTLQYLCDCSSDSSQP